MTSMIFFKALLFFILFTSCQKDILEEVQKQDPHKAMLGALAGSNPNKESVINLMVQVPSNQEEPSAQVSGYFRVEDELVEAETFQIGSISILDFLEDNSRYYQAHFWPIKNDTEREDLLTKFGNQFYVFVESNQFGDFEIQIDVPDLIQQDISHFQAAGRTVSKSNGIDIYWNPDVSNLDGVGIMILYDGLRSHRADSTLPDENITIFKVVDDIGQTHISSSELDEIPVGGIVTIAVIRGKQVIVESTEGNRSTINIFSNSRANYLSVTN